MEGFYTASLLKASGIGVAATNALIKHFGTAKEAWEAKKAHLTEIEGFSKLQREALIALKSKEPMLPEKIAEECKKKEIFVCTINDEEYPLLLKEIFRPPLVLFYRGEISSDFLGIAIVGARKATPYGKSVAEALSRDLAKEGAVIVSGAAYGIDSAAHKGALEVGRTIAVLGCGVDIAYPASNKKLLDEIAQSGAVISEYLPGTKPIASFFPARNRIISGLCRGTLVVEAAERSGSLITAEMALSEGRDIFSVPGSIFSELSRGTNKLIQNGAKLVQRADDILCEYGVTQTNEGGKQSVFAPVELTKEEAEIYKVLSYDSALPVDEIIYKLNGREVSNIAFQLLQMELKGIIKETGDHEYLRAGKEVRI